MANKNTRGPDELRMDAQDMLEEMRLAQLRLCRIVRIKPRKEDKDGRSD